MDANKVLVMGGSGFVGTEVVNLLAARGCYVCVPTRDRERAKHLLPLPTVDVLAVDVHDEKNLLALVRGMDAVINLVGVLHDARGARGFDAAHRELARKVVAACRKAGVRRLVHMSALHADPAGPSRYLRTKGEAEAIVKASGLDWTVFRPSVIFGPGDAFLNLFAKLTKALPVVVLAKPDARFQPVFVRDVARAMVRSLGDLASCGRRYDLCGPTVYTLRELVACIGAVTGRRRPIVGLNDTLSYLQAWFMEWLPVKLMTRDNYYSMSRDSVCDCAFPFGMVPQAIEAVVPAYLAGATRHGRYGDYRGQARRELIP